MSESTKLLASEVARRLKCSKDYVRVLERSGQLHADKTEKGWSIFDRKDVEQFAISHTPHGDPRRTRR